MKTNYHTHTSRCQHATGSDEEYVISAIKGGYQELGFSDHSPWKYKTDYVSDIRMIPEEFPEYVESIRETVHVQNIYSGIEQKFRQYADIGDYQNILRVYNQKGMLPQSRLCNICGINNKESYLNLVLSILKENKEDAEVIRTSIKESLGT